LTHITTKLQNPELPADRREKLTAKKACLEAKLANPDQHQGRCNRGGDKTHFWQMRLQHINDALAHPDLPADRRAKLTEKKVWFEAKLAGQPAPDTPTWTRQHSGGPYHGGPHHGYGHGYGHHGFGGPHHGYGFGGPGSYPHFGAYPPHQDFGCTPSPAGAEPSGWGRGTHGPHHGGPHGHSGGWGRGGCGKHLEEKLAWINQALEDPNTPPQRAAHLAQRKAMIEARIAQKGTSGCQDNVEKPWKAELGALRSAVGTAKVNLKNARQSGLKDSELTPFIDAVANAKANLCKRRLELKSAANQL